MNPRLFLFPLFPLAALALSGCTSEPSEPRPIQTYRVVNTYAHDPLAYCQGLIYHEDRLVESTGQYGNSSVRHVDLVTGTVVKKRALDPRMFGEGLTFHDGELWQLTWKVGIAFVLDPSTLEVKREMTYTGDGWGITSNGSQLITSNGSDTLTFRDPKTFKEIRTIQVHDGDVVFDFLNELEWIDGEIWANVWKREYIVRINPNTGQINDWVDMRGLYNSNDNPHPDSVLNGIAWDKANNRIFVTGKLWPTLFEIEVLDRANPSAKK
ncbi:MAG: glutaminyl-peptide cyclotransferase [Planctomycetota bacterium]|nr:glutaminyl-peptide cyclotransferase [Planctomycetota bacterium]MDA1113669.1 glutaminyl-peptide cyclotransferase [Planctomycetota bacterium]